MIKSELIQDILFLIIITFLVQYFIISRIITSSNEYITNSLNKIYLSTIVAIFVPLIYILMLDFKQGTISCNYYIGLGIVIGIITYAYRNNLGVTYYDWANWMIEHQSVGILSSQPILLSQPINSTQIQTQNIASTIITNNSQEIASLKQLISQMKTNGVYY